MTQPRGVRVPASALPALPALPGGAVRRARSAAPSDEAPLRLTARGRRVLLVIVLLVVGVGLALMQADRASADGPTGAVEVVRHVVQPGETLWDIARQVAGPEEDVRDVVLHLVELNRLPSGGLMAGQSIVIPTS
ncbi:MAG: LysM peptidoglycan-binding domain-containing protein [Cellulomonas sp.]|nr:LysM peptidoglycan-binding domain-containing protein [Cellulomonas sp.]